MSEYFPKTNFLEPNVKVKLDLSNYATKTHLKNATGVDTSSFAKKTDLANLKSDVDKSDINKLKNVPTNLNNLKSKVEKLGVDKLVPVPNDLGKLVDAAKNDFVKKDVYNAKIKNIEDKIPNLATTAALTTVENKIPNVNNLVKKTDYNTKINELEKKITDHDHDKYITTPEFNKLTTENFVARLAQANLANQSVISNFVKK